MTTNKREVGHLYLPACKCDECGRKLKLWAKHWDLLRQVASEDDLYDVSEVAVSMVVSVEALSGWLVGMGVRRVEGGDP